MIIRIEITLKIVLFVVASDQGILLLRNSLIAPFPIPIRNEYILEIRMVSIKPFSVLSPEKNKKKNTAVISDIQSKMMKLFLFISAFPDSKLAANKGIKNYFLPNGVFSLLNGIK